MKHKKIISLLKFIGFIIILIASIYGVVTLVQTKKSEVIEISTAKELYNVRKNLTGNYKLVSDIDLSEYGKDYNAGKGWVAIGTASRPFEGKFDGNGYSITGLYISTTSVIYAGLFGYVSDATIENVLLDNVDITIKRSGMLGPICGIAAHSTVIKGCCANGKVNSLASNTIIGGLVGENYAYIEDCYSTCDVYGEGISDVRCGGLIGRNWNQVANCYCLGKVEAIGQYSYAGSFIGVASSASSFSDCYYSSDLSGISWDIGLYDDKEEEYTHKRIYGVQNGLLQQAVAYSNWEESMWEFEAGSFPRLVKCAEQPRIVLVTSDVSSINITNKDNGKTIDDFVNYTFDPVNASHLNHYYTSSSENIGISKTGLIIIPDEAENETFTVRAFFESGRFIILTINYFKEGE